MRFLLILALALTTASAAHAQYQGYHGYHPPGMPKPAGAPEPFKPWEPAKPTSVYGEGAFSPAGEARRQRRENAAPTPGTFSPEGAAKRAREAAKRDRAISPY